MASRTTWLQFTWALVVISPATTTQLQVRRVSQATRLKGSCFRQASRMPSDTASATLSGWPSVTDSDVKKNFSLPNGESAALFIPDLLERINYIASKTVGEVEVWGRQQHGAHVRPLRA